MQAMLHRGLEELGGLRSFWLGAQAHPNSDHDHFLLVCRERPEVIEPRAISVWEGGRCVCILVGRLEYAKLPLRIGYLRLPSVSARMVTVVYGGILGTLSDDGARLVLLKIGEMLGAESIDAVCLRLLPEGSSLWDAMKERPRDMVCVGPRWVTHWDLALEAAPGFLLRGMRSKHRSWIKRKERDLNAAFGDKAKWTWHANIGDVDQICAKMEGVAKTTYQRALGAGFVNDEETRRRLRLFATKGQLRVLLLEVESEAKAFWIGEIYGDKFFSSATGYTPDVRNFEAGTLVFLRMVDELIKEGIRSFDFGLGDAHYKTRFGDRSWREGNVYLFRRNMKGRLLGAALRVGAFVDKGIRGLLDRYGWGDRVKGIWRAKLARQALRHVRAAKNSDC